MHSALYRLHKHFTGSCNSTRSFNLFIFLLVWMIVRVIVFYVLYVRVLPYFNPCGTKKNSNQLCWHGNKVLYLSINLSILRRLHTKTSNIRKWSRAINLTDSVKKMWYTHQGNYGRCHTFYCVPKKNENRKYQDFSVDQNTEHAVVSADKLFLEFVCPHGQRIQDQQSTMQNNALRECVAIVALSLF